MDMNLCIGDVIRECTCDDCPFDNKPNKWGCCGYNEKDADALVFRLGIEIQRLQAKRKKIVDKFLSEWYNNYRKRGK